MRREDLERPARVQSAVLEARLASLRAAAAARDETHAALNRLNDAGALRGDGSANLTGAAAEMQMLVYQRWADARRAELNSRLAGQTAQLLAAQDAARLAFGRDQALGRLLDRAKGKAQTR